MSVPLLELRDIRVDAGRRTILRILGLELPAATTLGVLGPNGAGKSTLLRIAGALRRPSSGNVLLDGRPADRKELRAVTAAVLQRPLLRRGSVRANIETGMRFHGLPRRLVRTRAELWMQRLGISDLEGQPAHSLSGGEAQRVSLARALAIEPRVMLLDEPFASLDAPTRGELLADLREALADTGTAALLVTHDRYEAAALTDQLAILHEGELRQHGPASVVLDHPADRDCARTLGFDTILSPALARRLLPDHSGELALRATDCSVTEPDSSAALRGTLRRIMPLGPLARVAVDVDGETILATAPVPLPAWLQAAAYGDPVDIRVDAAAARALPERVLLA